MSITILLGRGMYRIILVNYLALIPTILLTVSCSPIASPTDATRVVTIEITATPLPITPFPHFMESVSPKPGSVVSEDVYVESIVPDSEGGIIQGNQTQVCVFFDAKRTAISGEDRLNVNVLLERSYLYINDVEMEEISEYNQIILPDSDPYFDRSIVGLTTICWFAPLERGIHRAEFKFRTNSDYFQDYTWYFEIVE